MTDRDEQPAQASKTAVFIPNLNGGDRLMRCLESLDRQTTRPEVVVVDNGSTDASAERAAERFNGVHVIGLDENFGFGTALNKAVKESPGPENLILLNNDTECEPNFVAALLACADPGTAMVAGVLLQERRPDLIDSAGIQADRTLMGFDYLHDVPVRRLEMAAAPLGPTGGAALYRRAAFEEVGGFDERIFLYFEDLDLALRLRAAGGSCRLAADARALHSFSETLGPRSATKYSHTGWSRAYMMRRYGVLRHPRLAFRAVSAEAVVCAGQLLLDRTTAGLRGRLNGWRESADLSRRDLPDRFLLNLSLAEHLRLRRRRRLT